MSVVKLLSGCREHSADSEPCLQHTYDSEKLFSVDFCVKCIYSCPYLTVHEGFELQTSHNLFSFLRAHTQACTHTSSPLHTQLLEHLCACLKYICFQAYYLLKDAAPLKV